MIIIPPKTKRWQQTNTGEILGNLFATKNINFDQYGYAKLAQRSRPLVYNVANFGPVTSIQTLDGNTYYCITAAGTSVGTFSVTLDGVAPIPINGLPSGIKGDGVIWFQRLYVSGQLSGSDTEIYDYTVALGVQDSGIVVTTGNYHPLCVHEGLNYLAIGDGNLVKLYTSSSATSHSLQTTVTLPSNFEVRWMKYNNNVLYIGTRNILGGEAFIFTSDGVSVSATGGFAVPNSNWAFSGCIYEGVLVIMSSRGQLLRFNGSGFTELAHLPVYDTPYAWSLSPVSGFANGKMEARGMAVKGERIYMNLNGYIDSPAPGTQLYNQPSGVWIYDKSVGLYHKGSPTIDAMQINKSISAVNISTGVMTITAFTAPTGTQVLLNTTDVGGLVGNTFYYLIAISSTTFQLASSYSNAISGTYIPLTSGSTGTISMSNDITFGETSDSNYQAGAIAIISDLAITVLSNRGYTASQILYGVADMIDNAGNSISTLQTLTTGENRGYFTTPKLFSSNIMDSWSDIYTKYNNIFQGNDKVIIKYRNVDKSNYPLNVQSAFTWTSSNTFTSTADLSSVSTGDEVEICSGRGAGTNAGISSIVFSGGIWTVTLDENIPGAINGDKSFDMFFQNWQKIAIVTVSSSTYNFQYEKATLLSARASKWVQFKIILRGVSQPFVEELQVINKDYQPSK